MLAPSGRIIETTPAVARAPLMSARDLAARSEPTFVDRRPPGTRVVAPPCRPRPARGARRLRRRGRDAQRQPGGPPPALVRFAIAFPVALILSSLIGWLLAGAALRPVERMRREAAGHLGVRPHPPAAGADDRRHARPPGRDAEPHLRPPPGGARARAPLRRRREPRAADAAHDPEGRGRLGPGRTGAAPTTSASPS